MLVPHKKNQYALRAIYELARRYGEGPTKAVTIASRQAIPIRFLEVILNQLKHSGIVQSKRGFQGGYYLICRPQDISVGDVMRFIQPERAVLSCLACVSKKGCPFKQHCVFLGLWQQVQDAVNQIYDSTSLQDLIDNDQYSQY